MIKIERITSDPELRFFSNKTNELIKVKYPLDFLKKSKTFIALDNNNHIIGGFVLADMKDSRVLKSLPKDIVININNEEKELFEVTGLWICKEHKSNIKTLQFWILFYREIKKMETNKFIYAYSSEVKKLGKIYSISNPKRIFEGYTKRIEGMSSKSHEIVEIGTIPTMSLLNFDIWDFIIKKIFKKNTKLNI